MWPLKGHRYDDAGRAPKELSGGAIQRFDIDPLRYQLIEEPPCTVRGNKTLMGTPGHEEVKSWLVAALMSSIQTSDPTPREGDGEGSAGQLMAAMRSARRAAKLLAEALSGPAWKQFKEAPEAPHLAAAAIPLMGAAALRSELLRSRSNGNRTPAGSIKIASSAIEAGVRALAAADELARHTLEIQLGWVMGTAGRGPQQVEELWRRTREMHAKPDVEIPSCQEGARALEEALDVLLEGWGTQSSQVPATAVMLMQQAAGLCSSMLRDRQISLLARRDEAGKLPPREEVDAELAGELARSHPGQWPASWTWTVEIELGQDGPQLDPTCWGLSRFPIQPKVEEELKHAAQNLESGGAGATKEDMEWAWTAQRQTSPRSAIKRSIEYRRGREFLPGLGEEGVKSLLKIREIAGRFNPRPREFGIDGPGATAKLQEQAEAVIRKIQGEENAKRKDQHSNELYMLAMEGNPALPPLCSISARMPLDAQVRKIVVEAATEQLNQRWAHALTMRQAEALKEEQELLISEARRCAMNDLNLAQERSWNLSAMRSWALIAPQISDREGGSPPCIEEWSKNGVVQ